VLQAVFPCIRPRDSLFPLIRPLRLVFSIPSKSNPKPFEPRRPIFFVLPLTPSSPFRTQYLFLSVVVFFESILHFLSAEVKVSPPLVFCHPPLFSFTSRVVPAPLPVFSVSIGSLLGSSQNLADPTLPFFPLPPPDIGRQEFFSLFAFSSQNVFLVPPLFVKSKSTYPPLGRKFYASVFFPLRIFFPQVVFIEESESQPYVFHPYPHNLLIFFPPSVLSLLILCFFTSPLLSFPHPRLFRFSVFFDSSNSPATKFLPLLVFPWVFSVRFTTPRPPLCL